MTQTCRTCGVAKPWADFSKSSEHRSGRRTRCKACDLAYHRARYAANAPRVREIKRDYMRRVRVTDPARAARWAASPAAQWSPKRREQQQRRAKSLREQHFFRYRVNQFNGRYGTEYTATDFAAIWHRQRGLCALSGYKLDKSAHLDHILPRARGGGHTLDNLRWTSRELNYAKRDLTDEQFIALCTSVAQWIAARTAHFYGRAA